MSSTRDRRHDAGTAAVMGDGPMRVAHSLPRRAMLLAPGFVLAANGAAIAQQASGSPAVVVRPAVPCPRHVDDIAGLVLEGSGAPAGTVVVLGHAFRQGDLPRTATLAASLPDGRAVPVQADVTTRHPDGSALFAVVSLAQPALRVGERIGVMLSRRADPPRVPPLDVVAAAAGRSARVEVVPADGGPPWSIDLLIRIQDALLQPDPRVIWQSGPLAVQARVHVPVPPEAVGGARSARLVADVSLHADGSLWSDVWIRNDIAMRPGGNDARYSLRLIQDTAAVTLADRVTQFQYTGFGRMIATLARGAAHQPAHVIHDVGYLADAGAIARYDVSVGIAGSFLSSMATAMSHPDWHRPFSPRGIMQAMGAGGGRADIGVTTAWQAAWLISGSRQAAAFAIGQAEADGAIPWHFWDPSGGSDGRGGWMDTVRWPRFWTDARGGRPPYTLLQPISPDTGWSVIQSHQPDLSFVPYLLTGRRSILDGLQSQGVMGILTQWPQVRADPAAPPGARDTIIANGNQVRGAAWSLRQMDNAAWISPDDDGNTAFLRAAAAANWSWIRRQTPAWTNAQGEAHGWIPGAYTAGLLPPWQQDYFASSAAAAARRGSEDARAVLAWMANFLVGRFLARDRGFNPRDGVAYVLANSPSGTSGPQHWFKTWAAIAEAMRAQDLSNGDGWRRSGGDYGQLGVQTLAAIIDVLDDPNARRAHAWLIKEAPPYTSPEAFARDPVFNIIPKGGERGAHRQQRCPPLPGALRRTPERG
jgi:hypothetical protein